MTEEKDPSSSKPQRGSLEFFFNKQSKKQKVVETPTLSADASPSSSNTVSSAALLSPLESLSVASPLSPAEASVASTSSAAATTATSVKFASSEGPSDISKAGDAPRVRPVLSSYPVDKNGRSFLSKWYTDCAWLEYSVEKDAAFCFACRHFSHGSNQNRKVGHLSMKK